MRAVTHILQGKDEKAKAIKEILDLFLPSFRNINKDSPILIDLPKGLSPSIIGTGVSVLTDLYFEVEIKQELYTADKAYIKKGIQEIFEEFPKCYLRATKHQLKVIHNYKLELERLDKFQEVTPKLFMACIILETYKRCGILDFDLFDRANVYYDHCMAIVELFVERININDSVIPNPIFGCIEHMIKGDGDFILDGNLYDIKTTKSIVVDKNSRRQLLFYYLMNHRKYSPKYFNTKFQISKLYIYKARHGICIEIPINLRGANPLKVINTITDVEIGKVSSSEGIKIVSSMLNEKLEPDAKKELSISKPIKKKISKPKKEIYKFRIKKVFMCNETREVFDNVVKANEKYKYSKNTIYRYLNGSIKYATTKNGEKFTWRVMYKIV